MARETIWEREFEDIDGDALHIDQTPEWPRHLFFDLEIDGVLGTSVILDKPTITQLRDALNEWLAEQEQQE